MVGAGGGAGGQQPGGLAGVVAVADLRDQPLGEGVSAGAAQQPVQVVPEVAGCGAGEFDEGLVRDGQASRGGEGAAGELRVGEGRGDPVEVAADDGEEERVVPVVGVAGVQCGVQPQVPVGGQGPAVAGQCGFACGAAQAVELRGEEFGHRGHRDCATPAFRMIMAVSVTAWRRGCNRFFVRSGRRVCESW
ncbi:hypothetical protein BX265_6005 [Streptomyces sp. TLI_235]|nr:hypothetical protein BX265_6005 [Streptomyces sp. TLI_235]